MSGRHLSALAALIVGMTAYRAGMSQEKPEPPRRQPGRVALPVEGDTTGIRSDRPLPAIELPEYDITGTLVPRLEVAAKSPVDQERVLDPLAGQGPKYYGPYVSDQSVWKDGAAFLTGPPAHWGKVTAGYGWYVSPFGEAWYGQPGGPFSYLGAIGFQSSQGYVDHADYTRGRGSLLFGWELNDDFGALSRSDIRLGIIYQSDRYNFFGSSNPGLSRTVSRFATEVGVAAATVGEFGLTGLVRVGTTSVKDTHSVNETPFGLTIAGSRDFGTFDLVGGLDLWANPYNAPASSGDPFYVSLGADVKAPIAEGIELQGGLGMYVYRGSDVGTAGRIVPRVSVRWQASEWLGLFVRFRPGVDRLTLGDAVSANPYVTSDFVIRHQDRYIAGSVGADVVPSRNVEGRVSVEYSRTKNALAFVDTGRVGVWEGYYDGITSILGFRADLTWSITGQDGLIASLLVQTSDNTVTDKRVPNVPAALADLAYEHRFAFPLTIGAGAKVVGQRYADLQNERSLDAFTLISLGASYGFLPGWRVFLRIDNLFDVRYEWWEMYRGVPTLGTLGASYSW